MSFKDFKARLSNVDKENLLRQLYIQHERLQVAEQTIVKQAARDLERSLLEMWSAAGVEEVFKYKNRILFYKREGLTRTDLFCDLTYCLFPEVEDIANYSEATAEDYKVRVDALLADRNALK